MNGSKRRRRSPSSRVKRKKNNSPKKTLLKDVQCYHCRNLGHYSNKCPQLQAAKAKSLKEVQCYKCRKFGHYANMCQEEKKSESKEEEKGEDVSKNDNSMCIICMINPKTELLMPCKHICICKTCGDAISTCPICRVVIASREKVYIV